MNIKKFYQNFNIGKNRFQSRHPNVGVIYFLLNERGEIIYVGETEERRWALRREEHIYDGKKFHKMICCPTGKFKQQTLLIEKGLILILNPALNLERPSWRRAYLDAANNFLQSIEGDSFPIQIETKFEFLEKIVEVDRVQEVEVVKEVAVRKKMDEFNLTAQYMFYRSILFCAGSSMLCSIFLAVLILPYSYYYFPSIVTLSFSALLFVITWQSLRVITWAHRLGYNYLDSYHYFHLKPKESGDLFKDFFFARLGIKRDLNNENITNIFKLKKSNKLKNGYDESKIYSNPN